MITRLRVPTAVAAAFALSVGAGFFNPASAVATTKKKPVAPKITIKGFAFSPAKAKGSVGQLLTVANSDGAPHTFTADDGSFDLGTINGGTTKAFKLTKKGTIAFHCNFHSSMKGTITVA